MSDKRIAQILDAYFDGTGANAKEIRTQMMVDPELTDQDRTFMARFLPGGNPDPRSFT